jgi:hypothetical protein
MTRGTLYAAVFLAVFTLFLFAVSLVFTIREVNQAGAAAASVVQLCQAGNELRAQQVTLWVHLVAIAQRPGETAAQRRARMAQSRVFIAYVEHVFAPQNCAARFLAQSSPATTDSAPAPAVRFPGRGRLHALRLWRRPAKQVEIDQRRNHRDGDQDEQQKEADHPKYRIMPRVRGVERAPAASAVASPEPMQGTGLRFVVRARVAAQACAADQSHSGFHSGR